MPAKAGIPGGEKLKALHPLELQLRWGDAIGQFSSRLPARAQRCRMKWLKNPFVLVFEGFVLGAILLATSSPSLVDSRPAHPTKPLDSSVIPNPSR